MFQIHDPTTLNRQGNDRGLSYRSAIFYANDEQKRVALDTIADVEASGLWPGKVVTKVAAAGPCWEAEPEHQNDLERLPSGYTCHVMRSDWNLPVRQKQRHRNERHGMANATFAERCFRGVDMAFRKLSGVVSATQTDVMQRLRAYAGAQTILSHCFNFRA